MRRSPGGKAEAGGECEGDAEPEHASQEVALVGAAGLGCNG